MKYKIALRNESQLTCEAKEYNTEDHLVLLDDAGEVLTVERDQWIYIERVY